MTITMGNSFPRGRLEETHFPDLLHLISQRRESGVLRVVHLKIKKEIYFQEGQIVFAKSNDPDERLGELLLRRGRVTWKQLETAAEKIVPGKRLGTILVQEGIIKPSDLYHGVIDQVEDIIYSLFEWMEGEYEFTSGELPGKEDITLSISAPDVIATGIGRIRRWSWIRKGVVSTQAIYRRSENWSSVIKRMTQTPAVKTILSAMERSMPLENILQISPVNNFETCKLVWAFLVIGAVEKEVSAPQTPEVEEEIKPSVPPAAASLPTVILDRSEQITEPVPAAPVMPRMTTPVMPRMTTPAPTPELPPAAAPTLLRAIEPEPEPEHIPAPETIRIEPPAAATVILDTNRLASIQARVEPVASNAETDLPKTVVELPTPGLDLSFSDLADLTDQAMDVESSRPPLQRVESWEKNIEQNLKNFNERHRYIYEMIRIEIGANVGNLIQKVFKKTSAKYPLVLEGVQINEFGELQENSLMANIQGNNAENYMDAFEALIREERSLISAFLDKKRMDVIQAGYERLLEKQKAN
ncbi:MAG: hypothetical protein C5B54_00565 [Acidobacteria bacterium]|nr:MAG: hypothetical protein C5B54_00565 [Acidobacteriota bacterium]